MHEVLAKLAAIDAKLDALQDAAIEQRDAFREHARQDHGDFAAINSRVGRVERKQSWFVGAWTVLVLGLAVSVAFLKSALTP